MKVLLACGERGLSETFDFVGEPLFCRVLVKLCCSRVFAWLPITGAFDFTGAYRSGSQPLHQEASPGFGIVTQRPDGKGAMVNGIEPGGSGRRRKGRGGGWRGV